MFDVMVLKGRDVMREPLTVRRQILAETALKGRCNWTPDNPLRH
jgi:ATP-dependent DNA ligase